MATIFITGATGFIGGRVAGLLVERGDRVRALVRSPEKASGLRELGCELIEGSLSDPAAIERGLDGADAAIHGAAIYEMGVPRSRHAAMRTANVEGTRTVLGAALAAGTPKVVYVSTVQALGDTRGELVGEDHHPDVPPRSIYEETKREAHDIASELIERGLPCVVVQPGGVYGPDDHSELGDQILRAARGRQPAVFFPRARFQMVHVDDVAAGVLLALDRGEPGQSYILGGEVTDMLRMLRTSARLAGRRSSLIGLPDVLVRMAIPVAPVVTRLLRIPPNLRELIASTADATYLGSDAKARRELGYDPRPLERGLRDTLVAEGLAAA